MNKRQIYIIGGILLAMFCIFPSLADAQCSMCNATATTSTEGNKEAALALNSGILFLMGIPYVLLTCIVIIWLRFRKQRKAEQAS